MEQDSVDRHIAHWIKEIPELDPLTEGVITRMQLLVKHLKQQRHASAAARELEDFEFETLHMLGGCPGNQATPGEIAAWLYMSPAAITGRIDALERRGLVRRLPAPGDRRKVLVQLTAAGRRVWRVAGNEQGAEEQRILAALDHAEQKELAGFLRRMLLVVDRPELLPTPGAKRSRGRAARGR